jgi:hypothetical protein
MFIICAMCLVFIGIGIVVDNAWLTPLPATSENIIDSETANFLGRIESTLSWAAKDILLTNNHGISKDDVVRLYKIRNYLRQRLGAVPQLHPTCSAQETHAQTLSLQNRSRLPRICVETEYYKVAQIAIPEALTFVDAGANRGYIGAAIVALWGGYYWSVYPRTLQIDITKVVGRDNACGYCDTCNSLAIPLHCPHVQRYTGGGCMYPRKIAVTSFDGLECAGRLLNGIIRNISERMPLSKDVLRDVWKYHHAAVSDKTGVANFGQPVDDENCFFEARRIQGGVNSIATNSSGTRRTTNAVRRHLTKDPNTLPVRIVTIDSFVKSSESGFAGQSLDVLKFDIEGHDLQVSNGFTFSSYHQLCHHSFIHSFIHSFMQCCIMFLTASLVDFTSLITHLVVL